MEDKDLEEMIFYDVNFEKFKREGKIKTFNPKVNGSDSKRSDGSWIGIREDNKGGTKRAVIIISIGADDLNRLGWDSRKDRVDISTIDNYCILDVYADAKYALSGKRDRGKKEVKFTWNKSFGKTPVVGMRKAINIKSINAKKRAYFRLPEGVFEEEGV